ncbi:MAG: class I SAM-dependent methyltransferase [Bryobacteraceae bacterium]|nr:class I SAM-dependent methyltransferase [Bryobacteraceae bacterium]
MNPQDTSCRCAILSSPMENNTVFLPVADAYDRWSAFYDSYPNPMVFAASLVLPRAFHPAAGLDVFEFGCGTGRNLEALRQLGARNLAGCDLSLGMLAVARARNAGAVLLQHDITQPLPLAPASYDAALFSLTLEHLPALAPPLRHAARILRPGGRIVIIEIHPFLSAGGVAAHFDHHGEEVRMPTYPHQFAAWLNAFAEAGLRSTLCREWSPRSLGLPQPLANLKRGPDFPLAVEFHVAV